MKRPLLVGVGIAAGAAAVAILTTAADEPAYAPTLLFTAVMLTLLGLILSRAIATFRVAYAEQRRTRSLLDSDPAATAGKAVMEERTRLAHELDACLRATLLSMRHELPGIDGDDSRERARRIHLRAREATSELRRQLGLLRTDTALAHESVPVPPAPRLTRRTIVFAAVVASVAALENWGYYAAGEYTGNAFIPGWSLPLTALAAATVVGWRVAPATAAAALAALLVVPPLTVGAMIGSGGWIVATVGCLTWALASRGVRDVHALLATACMTAAVVWSRLRDDPENAEISFIIIAVTWVVGFVVGWNRRREERAVRSAVTRQAEIDAARDEAVQSERLVVARDLHDVVSHAVGVIAMQAAAAEVSLPARPEVAARAFNTIDRVISEALAELDRVVPSETREESHYDLTALVERIRATGTTVTLAVHRDPAHDVDPIVYRVVQEGLTNAVRHAPSAQVCVLVETVEDTLRVKVTDDGPGPAADDARGFGLIGLAERVSLRGGTLRSGPGPDGRGFVVEATVPARQVDVV
jgi:signal transduction histidine kinase